MLANLSLLILLPVLLSAFAFLNRNYYKTHFAISLKIIVSCLILSFTLPISTEIYTIDFGFIKLKFMCDIYSYLFGILVNIVWLLTVIYCYGYNKIMIDRKKLIKFNRYLSLTIFTVLANGYAGDLNTLFFFYFFTIIFTAPLVIIKTNKSSIKAYLLYLKTHVLTSLIFFLPGILILKFIGVNGDFKIANNNQLNDYINLSSLVLTLFVFGIAKNCILPFHQWITRTTIAPTPISAMLHSVAAVKSGSIAMIKIITYVFGLELTRNLTSNFWTGGWIFYLCGITALYSAYRAYKTTKIKSRFAYSTISQLSYILSSILVANQLSMMASILHIFSHSLCKITLFFIAGIFSAVYNTHNTKEASKIAPNIKFWIACLTFCGASIIGFPLLPGSYGKDYMLISEFKSHHYSALVFLIAGSIINILYIYPIFKAGFFSKKNHHFKIHYIPLSMRLAIIITVSIAILFSYFIGNITSFFADHFFW
jgi:multicomponent Na+:H+ antiporter subunit D